MIIAAASQADQCSVLRDCSDNVIFIILTDCVPKYTPAYRFYYFLLTKVLRRSAKLSINWLRRLATSPK